MPRERLFLPCPRIQIVTEDVSTKTPSRSECSQGSANGALIDDSLLKRLQDRDEEHLLDQKAKVGRPSRARGHISQ